ncbi:MAG: TIGR04211 family SH3 domain-containing protein [Sulfurifustaceae bacterium]
MRRAAGGWILVCVLIAPLAFAETAYVTDQLTAALRADPSVGAPVIKTVTTGTALEVIERNGEVVLVRDPQGTEGWVKASLLMAQPPASVQLKATRAELDRTRAQLMQAQTDLDKSRAGSAPPVGDEASRAEIASLRSQLEQAQAELKKKEVPAVNAAAAPDGVAAPTDSIGFSWTWLGIAFAMLLLGFVGGIVWVRESIRRRMGGLYLRI